MVLSSTLSWLVDAAAEVRAPTGSGELGAHLLADGLPLAGGALTLASASAYRERTWLWRAESGEVIEALGFVAGGPAPVQEIARQTMPAGAGSPDRGGRRARGRCRPDRRALTELDRRRVRSRRARPTNCVEAARFAAAPLAALAARATLTAALEAYLGRRSAARVLAGALTPRYRGDHPGGVPLRRFARIHGTFR